MKKIFSILGIALGATLILSSCGDNIGGSVTPAGEHQIVIRASEGVDTRTHIDGTAVKWDASDEYLKVYEVATPTEGDAVTSKGNSAEGATSDGGNTMSFGVTLSAKDAATYDFDYYAFYPSSAYHSATDVVTNVAINTSDTQTPTATSFDPAADLLIAEGITGEASQPENLAMRFTRMVAVGRMTVKNLESTDPVTRITFSAKVGGTPVVLAGRTAYDLTNASVKTTYGSNVAATAIILDYSALDLTANTSAGMTAFFTCYPFALNSSTPGSFKVIVETATQTFTKEVSVSTAKGLVFNVGKASTFSVDMDGIAGEDKAADLRYAFLSFDDYDNTPGTSNSYSNVTVTKTHGDAWETSALKNTGGIQINTGHYIKLPDFVENIKTVIVTLSAASADITLALETTSTGEDEDIASTITTSDLVYEFDLSSDTKKTAYLLSSGTIKFAKIEVYAGEDNRSALSTPTGLTASLNETNPAVTNTIDVAWTAVDNAGSYIVTMHPETGDDVIAEANTNSCSIVGLQYEKSYTATVVAVPADPYVYKNSSASAASSAVETGAEPSGEAYELITNLASVTTDQYVIAAHVGSKYYALSNTFATKIDGAEIAVVNNKISGAAAEDYVVTITTDGEGGVSIYNGTKYLNLKSSKTDFEVGDAAVYSTISAGEHGTFRIANASNRGLIYQASTTNKFGNYSTGNVDGSTYFDIELFKLVDPRDAAPISWSSASGSATWSSSGITSTLPSLTNESSLEVTYTSSDESVATIDGSGVVTIVAGGSTTISATYTGTAVSTYKTTTVSYALTVTDSRTACETPAFSPAAGEVAADTEVTITSGTTGSTIYYTTDGSTPTLESTHGSEGAASATVTIDGAQTVKAIAIKDNYLVSATAEAAYTITGVVPNDGSLEHPYTVAEALAIIAGYSDKQKSATEVYVSGTVAQVGAYNSTYHSVTYDISDDGSTTNTLNIYSGRNVGNTDFSSNSEIAVSDKVVVYGYLYLYGSTKEMYQSNYISTLNGTNYLAPGSLSVSTNDAKKQITVTWDAASGSNETITYTVSCGAQTVSPNPTAAGSYTFTMAEYGTYTVTVVASASDANSATVSTSATISAGTTYTITFAKGTTFTDNVTTYTGSFVNTCAGLELTLANVNNGGNNNWTTMRAGRKTTASTPTITTNSAISEAIRTVTLHITQVETSPITSAKLYVSSSSDFSTKDTYNISITGTGDASATVTNPATGKFYKIEIVTDNTGTANGFLRFDKIIYTTN